MKLGRVLFVAGVLALCALWAQGAQAAAEFQIAPPPAWVKPLLPDADDGASAGGAVQYLLSDSQTSLVAKDRVAYRHFARKALNTSGVDEISHLEINFNPAFQSLTLHAVNVWREGRLLPRLEASKVRVLQREKELEYRIYDGTKTATVIIDDVRVGDTVEWAYSVKGSNPAFGNRLSGGFDLQWGTPVGRVHARLIVPKDRTLQWLLHNKAPAGTTAENGDLREHVWDLAHTAGLTVESGAPAWFDPFMGVQWSEFKDWADVAQWAVPFYRVPVTLDRALQAEVSRIAAQSSVPAERLQLALQFVQREVRYLGVEIGAGSYVPSAPGKVLERRFGDCKDKTLLTLTLLRALGIDAWPALVHTQRRRGVADVQPSPTAFNHVLVLARVNGQDHWLDPTRSPQRARLDRISQADFGRALVIDTTTRGLIPMESSDGQRASRSINSRYDARAGLDQPVELTITTVAEGRSAESLRGYLSSDDRERVQKQYLNYYAGYYPDISVRSPFTVDDDEVLNRVTVTEHYLIADFWPRAKNGPRRYTTIYTPDMEDMLRQPKTTIRNSPLGISHPAELSHTSEVLLPEDWKIKPENFELMDAAFHFERSTTLVGRRLLLESRFKTRADVVEASGVKAYVAALEKARNQLDYQLYTSTPAEPAKSGIDTGAVLIFMLGLAFCYFAARWVIKRANPAVQTLHADEPVAATLPELKSMK